MRYIKWRYIQWPWVTPNYPQTTSLSIFCITFHIFVVGGDSNLVDRLIVASASPWMTNLPDRSMVKSSEFHLNFNWHQQYLWNSRSYSGQIWYIGRLRQVPAHGRQITLRGVVRVTWPILIFGPPMISLEWLKLESSNSAHRYVSNLSLWMTNHP